MPSSLIPAPVRPRPSSEPDLAPLLNNLHQSVLNRTDLASYHRFLPKSLQAKRRSTAGGSGDEDGSGEEDDGEEEDDADGSDSDGSDARIVTRKPTTAPGAGGPGGRPVLLELRGHGYWGEEAERVPVRLLRSLPLCALVIWQRCRKSADWPSYGSSATAASIDRTRSAPVVAVGRVRVGSRREVQVLLPDGEEVAEQDGGDARQLPGGEDGEREAAGGDAGQYIPRAPTTFAHRAGQTLISSS